VTDYDITLVTIDTYAHELTKLALERTLSVLPCRDVLVFSDKNFFTNGRWVDINPIGIEDYNFMMVKHLWPFIRTEHVLVVQYDGMAVHKQYWQDRFLDYDYIGAVWPWPHHPPGFKVGNGGFSLRSRKLLNTLKDKRVIQRPNLPMYEDLYIGVHYKDFLVEQGIRIADEATAAEFSQEHPPGAHATFGFHGTFNVPYYLTPHDIETFIHLNPGWGSEGSALLAIHTVLAGYRDLGQLAFDTARKRSTNFDQRVVSCLRSIPELATKTNIKQVYELINVKN